MMVKRNVNATFSHPKEEKKVGWRDKIKGMFGRERSSTQDLVLSRMSSVDSGSKIENN